MANGRRVAAGVWGLPWTDCAFSSWGWAFRKSTWLKEIASCSECGGVAGVRRQAPGPPRLAGRGSSRSRLETLYHDRGRAERAEAHAVIVALRRCSTKRRSLAALGRGLHVLTEKPWS